MLPGSLISAKFLFILPICFPESRGYVGPIPAECSALGSVTAGLELELTQSAVIFSELGGRNERVGSG